MSETKELQIERRENIGVVTLSRPEKLNALTPDMLLGLHEQLEAWAAEDEVRVVVVRGAGEKAFSAGYDITAIPTHVTEETREILTDRNPLELALTSVKRFPYPTIAMLNGKCFGAALNLAMCCDLRIGADDIAVGMPPAKLGLVYPYDGIAQFVSVLGMSRAREVFFTARTYRGEQVREVGLVERLVARTELEDTVFATAAEIAANSAPALRGIKRVLELIETAAPPTAAAREEVELLVARSMGGTDAKTAQATFLKKG